MASEPWTERVDDGVLEIEAEGFDADQQDAIEAQAALRRATQTDEPDPWLLWRRPQTSLFGALLAVGLVLGWFLLHIANALLPGYLGVRSIGFLFQFLLFVIGFVVPIAIAARLMRRRPKELSFTTERFRLRLDQTDLTVEGLLTPEQRFALSEIAEFEGDRRLSIVKTDGTKQHVAMSLVAAKRHPELAARLNEALRGTRARIGGYRGARARESDATDELSENDDVAQRMKR